MEQRADSRPHKVARVEKATTAPGGSAMPTVRRGRSRSKWDNKPRHPRKAFVRKAAVMSAVPRIVAGPPTPATSGSESESDASAAESAHEPESARVAGRSDTGVGSDAEKRDGGANKINDDGGADAGEDGGANADAGDDNVGVNADASVLDVLAHQLAARSRNPRLFPAECWAPGARAVFAAAQASRGLLPIAPVAARGNVPAGTLPSPSPGSASALPMAAATPPHIPASASLPPPSLALNGESSEEMDDDALFMAYVTPPASPAAMASPAVSSFRGGRSSRKRRRESDSRAARGAVAASGPSADDDANMLQSSATLRRVLDAIRNGFSSLRREVTRLRAEVLIVKSQAASTLRRIDGIAASVDECDSRADAVLGRLGELEQALRLLSARIPSSSDEATGGQEGGNEALVLVAEIKVSAIFYGLVSWLL